MTKVYIVEKRAAFDIWRAEACASIQTRAESIAYNYTNNTGIATRVIERVFYDNGKVYDSECKVYRYGYDGVKECG